MRWVLLIRQRHTAAARVVVVAFYILVVVTWRGFLEPNNTPLLDEVIVASGATVALRALAGFGVRALDARRRPAAATRLTAPGTSSGASSDTAAGPSS